jgi:ribosomal protein S18 acetylase RimI-like enzyme
MSEKITTFRGRLPMRLASKKDIPNIEQLIVDTYTKYVSRMNGVTPGPMRDNYHEVLENHGIYLLDDDNGLAALLVLIDEPDHLLLDNIAVRPDLHGYGIGKDLFQFADEHAKYRGFRELRLYTAEAMWENIALYEKTGWIEYDRFVQNGYPRVFMKKPLSNYI